MKGTEDIKKKRWENRALVLGIASILSNLCSFPISGVPMGVPIGIFAIAFAFISAKGGMRGKAVAGMITGILGVMMGLAIYFMILFLVASLKDPRFLSQFKPEQIKLLQDYIQLYIAH